MTALLIVNSPAGTIGALFPSAIVILENVSQLNTEGIRGRGALEAAVGHARRECAERSLMYKLCLWDHLRLYVTVMALSIIG